jgi:hypothetical protein
MAIPSLGIRGSAATMIGGVALVIGLVLSAIAGVMLRTDWRFAREGQTTRGTILTKMVNVSTSRVGSTGTNRTRHYEATYRYAVGGTTIEGRDELTKSGWDTLTEGAPADVLFLSTDPASSRLAGPRPWIAKTLLGPIGLVVAVCGAALFVRGRRDAATQPRLERSGVTTRGTVRTLQAGRFRINDETMWRLEYEYQDAAGHRHVSVHDLPEDEAGLWKVGEVGVVRYDPQRPADVVWLGRP